MNHAWQREFGNKRGYYYWTIIYLFILIGHGVTGSAASESIASDYNKVPKKMNEGVREPAAVWRCYWKDGLQIDSPKRNFTMRFNSATFIDGGYTGVDDELGEAFPNLEGSVLKLRRLTLSAFGTIYDWMEFKFEIDFSNLPSIRDDWFRFSGIPVIGQITLGHMKEPFSLEELTSATARTFMEKALPTDAFTPGRNIGVGSYTAVFDQRITWGVGAFLNTGSFGNEGEAKDRINESNGFGISGRITGLPWYSENGDKLLHLGLSYRHDFRESDNRDFPLKVRAKPESALTNDRLVDTGSIFANNSDLFDAELAVVHGPLSFQGEYFYGFIDANSQDDPGFWGFYLLSSYFLSGEHRNYNTKSGVFTRIKPKHQFHPARGGWGAWEIGVRFSYVDLNDKGVNGGKEHNLTAGLNWYLSTKTRFMFNYILALVEDRQSRPSIEDGSADIFQARFQIAF